MTSSPHHHRRTALARSARGKQPRPVRKADGALACAAPAPQTRQELQESAKTPCPKALFEEQLPHAGAVREVQVYGGRRGWCSPRTPCSCPTSRAAGRSLRQAVSRAPASRTSARSKGSDRRLRTLFTLLRPGVTRRCSRPVAGTAITPHGSAPGWGVARRKSAQGPAGCRAGEHRTADRHRPAADVSLRAGPRTLCGGVRGPALSAARACLAIPVVARRTASRRQVRTPGSLRPEAGEVPGVGPPR